jgi:hypothetical protein
LLHSAAAAGMGGAALALLGGAQRAEAQSQSLSDRLRVTRAAVALDISAQNGQPASLRVRREDEPNVVYEKPLDPTLEFRQALVEIPIRLKAADAARHRLIGSWWTPLKNIQNLTKFGLIDVGVRFGVNSANRPQWYLQIVAGPAPDVSETPVVTILVHVFHEVF